MRIEANSPSEYIKQLPEERAVVIQKLRETIAKSLPQGFEECMSYGMISFAVPHSIYPNGYHCDKSQPLPFISIASQKNFVGFYHMGIYVNEELMTWFKEEYTKTIPTKIDMGKSCLRLKKMDQIPYELIAELCTKISVKEWISTYESTIKR